MELPIDPGSYLSHGQWGFVALLFALSASAVVTVIAAMLRYERFMMKDRDEMLADVIVSNTRAVENVRKEVSVLDDRVNTLEDFFKRGQGK